MAMRDSLRGMAERQLEQGPLPAQEPGMDMDGAIQVIAERIASLPPEAQAIAAQLLDQLSQVLMGAVPAAPPDEGVSVDLSR